MMVKSEPQRLPDRKKLKQMSQELAAGPQLFTMLAIIHLYTSMLHEEARTFTFAPRVLAPP